MTGKDMAITDFPRLLMWLVDSKCEARLHVASRWGNLLSLLTKEQE